MSRHGRFSKLCAPLIYRVEEANALFEEFNQLFSTFDHPAELIGGYIILISKFRKKHLWKGNYVNWYCPISSNQFLDFWSKTTLRGIPLKVNEVLVNWYLGNYSLELTFDIPSDKKMLELQSLGKRYITLFKLKEEWINSITHGRDHFSFTIHDLIHAHEFFSNSTSFRFQTHFYKKICYFYDELKNACSNPVFQQELSYLVSDINTHPKHLESYLKSLIERYHLKNELFFKIMDHSIHDN